MKSSTGKQKFMTYSRRMNIKNLLATGAVLSMILLVSGCSSTQEKSDTPSDSPSTTSSAGTPSTTPVEKKKLGPDDLAPGYEVRLGSIDDENLNGKYRIEFDGRLKLPYNQTVQTLGLTRSELKDKLVEQYRGFFKNTPNLSVTVVDEKLWIDVRGLVEKPGRYLIKPTASLDEALALAGGVNRTAQVRYVKFQQLSGNTTIKLSDYYSGASSARVPSWEGGDVLFLQSERDDVAKSSDTDGTYLQVLGEVRTPGEYRFVPGADFYYYMAKAGGPTQNANLLNIEILRGDASQKKESIRFEASGPKKIPGLRANDMVLIHADKQTQTERTISLASTIAGIINTALLIILLF